MTDEDVVKMFVGNYEQKDEEKIENEDPGKDFYYPKEGVKLRIDKVPLTGVAGGAYAKVTVTDVDGTFGAKLVLERAAFRVVGNTLVARDLIIEPGLLLTETLTITKDDGHGHKEMEHALSFSDGKHGKWICEN